jgi:nucleotide-binding universal stress UspA family protein
MPLPKTILVPVDLGASSEHVLSYAIELAKAFNAELVVMHAYEIPMVGFPDGTLVATAEIASRLVESTQIGLKRLLDAHAKDGVPIRSVLKQGVTWRMINDAAIEEKAGLIVMGTHGRHGLPRALLGSVAEKVVRTARCAVLTLHREDV